MDWLTPAADGLPTQALDRVTSLSVAELRGHLLAAGFPDQPPLNPMPVDDDLVAWQRWLELALHGGKVHEDDTGVVVGLLPALHFTGDQLGRFWAAVDRFPFYDVVGVDWHRPADRRGR